MDDVPNAYPVSVEFEINIPRVSKRYYSRHLRFMRATVQGKMIFNWRGSFRPRIVVSELILQLLELMILISTILVRLVSGGMKVTL